MKKDNDYGNLDFGGLNFAKLLGKLTIPDDVRNDMHSKELCDQDFEKAVEFALDVINESGEIFFTMVVSGFHMEDKLDGKAIFMVPNFPPSDDPEEKNAAYISLGENIATRTKVFPYFIVTMMDSWSLQKDANEEGKFDLENIGKIKDHPDRIEVMVVIGLSFMGEYYCSMIRYRRKDDGSRVATMDDVHSVVTGNDQESFKDNVVKFIQYGWLHGLAKDKDIEAMGKEAQRKMKELKSRLN
jgi:hypothetical protein